MVNGELEDRMSGGALFDAHGRVVLPGAGVIDLAIALAEGKDGRLSRQPSLERAVAVRNALRPHVERRGLGLGIQPGRRSCDVYVMRPG